MSIPIPNTWIPGISGTVTTVNTGVVRYLQDGVTPRLEQDGTTKRVLQPDVVQIGPIPNTWSNT